MGDRSLPTIGLVALAVALAASGWWIADSLLRFRTADQTVTVKGLAEREMPADLRGGLCPPPPARFARPRADARRTSVDQGL